MTDHVTKLLFISVRADLGGGPEHLMQLTSALGSRVEAYIACPDEQPYATRYSSLPNATVLPLLPHRQFTLTAVFTLLGIIKKKEIQIIHSHGKGAGAYSRILGLLSKTPVIHTFHGVHVGSYNALKRAAYCLYEQAQGALTKKIIAVSAGERMELVEQLGITSSKICVIENGVEGSSNPKISIGSFRSPLRVLNANRFDFQKNPEDIFSIAKEVKKRALPVRITVIGTGERLEEFRRLVVDEELQPYIDLHGGTDKPREIMRESDVFLSTSRWEGMPLALLEAMSEGLVLVASNVTGNKDILEQGPAGLLFDLHDIDTAVQHLSWIIDNPSEASDLGARGPNVIESHYSIEAMAEKTHALYLEVITNSRK